MWIVWDFVTIVEFVDCVNFVDYVGWCGICVDGLDFMDCVGDVDGVGLCEFCGFCRLCRIMLILCIFCIVWPPHSFSFARQPNPGDFYSPWLKSILVPPNWAIIPGFPGAEDIPQEFFTLLLTLQARSSKSF